MESKLSLRTRIKPRLNVKVKTGLVIRASISIFLAGIVLLIVINHGASKKTIANTTGLDYTFTGSSGTAWTTGTNWDRGSVPGSTDNAIIPLGKTCNCGSSNITCANLTVNGTLNVNISSNSLTASGTLAGSGAITITGTLSLNGGSFSGAITNNNTLAVTGSLTMNGTLTNAGTITNSGSLAFGSGSTYVHNQDGGTIPTATWNVNSLCKITGVTSTAPTGVGQSFGNFEWNCTQSTDLDLTGLATVNGNLLISGTGNTGPTGETLRLKTDMTVGGNFTTSGNTSVNINHNSCTSNRTYNIGGNISLGGYYFFTNNTTYSANVFLTGSGKTINITTTNFLDFTANNPPNSKANFNVNNGAIYTLGSNVSIPGNNTFTVQSGGTLNTGTYNINSTGTFTLASGGTLGIGSPQGITSSGSTGNIQTSIRNYNSNANYYYNGTDNQTVGNGLPVSVSTFNLNMTGGSGHNTVTMGANISVTGDLTVTSGILDASTSNYDINVGGNWYNSGSFTARSSTVTFNSATSQQNIAGTSQTTFYNLAFNNTFATAPQIVLGQNTVVKDSLVMISGRVNLAADTLTLGASGTASILARTASATTNWFYGGVLKRYWIASKSITSTSGNYYGLFPMGASYASSYRPVEINTTANPTGGGYFTVNHIDTTGFIDLNPLYNDGGTNIQRISKARFKTSISGVTGGTYKINVTMTGYTTGTLSDYRLAIYTGGTTASAVGTHAAASGTYQNPTVKRTGITTISNFNNDFRIATTNKGTTTLPVELISFDANRNGNQVDLSWATASETNNDYFTIERSTDGETYTSIERVQGAGNSNSIIDYKFTDTKPLRGINYYRLKQTDFDGVYKYFDPVAVNMTAQDNGTGTITAGPNPFTDAINVSYTADNDGIIEVKLFDMSGREVKTIKTEVNSGTNTFTISDNEELPEGIYLLGVINKDKMTPLIKMIKSR